jgi:asparagine synthase (glutamine-hydrolysing)
MCGIFGVFGELNTHKIKVASMLLKHRGPDDYGLFYDGDNNVTIAHTRLSIQDLSHRGHQPMISNDGSVALVFNGEIYNCNSLRDTLIEQGFYFNGQSDTEVLLNLYLDEDVNMLSYLNGIFSFAIWDARKNFMFLARDALGVKPLYYAYTEHSFIFASEIKAIIPILSPCLSIDHKALQQYLTFLWSPGEKSPLKNIKKLPPGEAMLVRDSKIDKKWKWYQLPVFKNSKLISPSKRISGVESHLRKAVHKQMLSDVPVGAFLSGGLDSSAIVTFARELNPKIPCFTIETSGGQEEGMADDLPYAKKVAKHLDVPLHVVSIDSDKMAAGLENMVVMLDEPLADPAPLNVLYISQLARDNGIKVLLSGTGGDDIFSGYRRHHAIRLDKYLQLIPPDIRSGIENFTSSMNKTNSFYRRLSKLFNGSTLEGDERIVNYFRWADDKTVRSLFTKEVRAELEAVDAAEPMFDFLHKLPDDLESLERMLALEQRFFLADHNLTYTDKMSMAAGVEVRVPFLDLDLVEYAAQIPNKYKQNRSVGKWVLKKAMEPYLPHEVIYRPKTGFGAPLRRWMQFELRELLGDLLSEESLRKRSVFDSKAVHQLIKKNDSGVVDASYTLLSLMCIEIWCRQFVDGKFDYKKVYGNLNNGC